MAAYSSGKRTVLKTVRRETVRGFESYRCRHLVNKDARRNIVTLLDYFIVTFVTIFSLGYILFVQKLAQR